MAQQPPHEEVDKWKVHSKCELYCDDERKWIEGVVQMVFEFNDSEWIRVKYGPRMRDIRSTDPYLRRPNGGTTTTTAIAIPMTEMQILRDLAVQHPEFGSIFKRFVAQSPQLAMDGFAESLVSILVDDHILIDQHIYCIHDPCTFQED